MMLSYQGDADPQGSSVKRPKSDVNIAPGSPVFIPIDLYFIKDDVMFLKIIVD